MPEARSDKVSATCARSLLWMVSKIQSGLLGLGGLRVSQLDGQRWTPQQRRNCQCSVMGISGRI